MADSSEARIEHVSEIIRDMWPHRMSRQAAKAIDDYYVAQFGSTVHNQKRLATAEGERFTP